ncbi:MAG: VCBS repeat-containing protein [Planctomycetes bacterium]|nr:VCBS repeat-containing protein [Planctomycetota bacterium]
MGVAVLCVSAHAQNASGTVIFRFDGPTHWSEQGAAVANAGDQNGDGINDMLVAAPGECAVYLYSSTDGALIHTWYGERHATGEGDFGCSIDSIADLDGDGTRDIVIGERLHEHNGFPHAGQAYVYSGATDQKIYTFSYDEYSSFFGAKVCVAGDLNMDGFEDILIGAPGADIGGMSGVGFIHAYSGADGSLLYRIEGNSATTRNLGSSMSRYHDTNGNNRDDFLVGWGYEDLRLHNGRDGSILNHWAGSGSTINPTVIARIHDWDGDGIKDFMTTGDGAGQHDAAYIMAGWNGAVITTIDSLGGTIKAMTKVKDLSGDGVDDIAFGMPTTGSSQEHTVGLVQVHDGVTGDLLYAMPGERRLEQMGFSLANMGDINGDGLGNFLMGAPGTTFDFSVDRGTAHLFSCEQLPLTLAIPGPKAGETFEARIFGAPWKADLYLCYSMSGAGPTPWNYGLAFDLSMPINHIVPFKATDDGDAFFGPAPLPPSLPSGTQVWVQIFSYAPSVSGREFELSNMVPVVLQ